MLQEKADIRYTSVTGVHTCALPIYDNLRDLRFEYRSGKYSEGDFEAMKTALENEAALALAEIDQVTQSQVKRPRGARPASAEDRKSVVYGEVVGGRGGRWWSGVGER